MLQFTVRGMVAVCCRVPEVAVMVIVEVTGWELPPPPPPPEPELELPPPQPLSRPRPIMQTASINSICKRRRFLKPMQNSAAASAVGKSGRRLLPRLAVVAEVAIVTVVEADAPDGVTVVGEKLQDAPAGSPEQLKETAELKPFCGVIEIDAVPLWPWVTVIDAGDDATEKSGGGKLMVYVALATALGA
jgi:hypothetical protein